MPWIEPASAPEPWAVVDTWRSIWVALALVRGHDPAAAVEGHKRLCRELKGEYFRQAIKHLDAVDRQGTFSLGAAE